MLLTLLLACDGPSTERPADADGDGYAVTDCNDESADAYPGAEEVCDGIDNDCNGEIDEQGGMVVHADADGDGYGDPATSATLCEPGSGWVSNYDDCDDASSENNPDAAEVCDGVDNNCDGTIDEDTAIDASVWYEDFDGDGVGNSDVAVTACDQPSGYVLTDGDCDDADPIDETCSCETLTIAVLPGWGGGYSDSSLAWSSVDSNQSSYGDCVISFVDVAIGFTYGDLVKTGAEVLLIGDVGGGSTSYSAKNLDAISDYLSKGHGGLVLTYAVSYGGYINDDLVEWVGIDPATMTNATTSSSTTMVVLDTAHPLATGLSSKSANMGGYPYSQELTTSWDKALLSGAEIVMESSAQDAFVVAYEDAWRGVWFTWMVEYDSTTASGEQLIYNGLIWSAGYTP